jgi:hypothetical protein
MNTIPLSLRIEGVIDDFLALTLAFVLFAVGTFIFFCVARGLLRLWHRGDTTETKGRHEEA